MDHDQPDSNDRAARSYWDGCAQKQLLITHCDDCDYWIYYPRFICPRCWSTNVIPKRVSSHGKVYSFALIHSLGDSPGQAPIVPVASVELPEQAGLRIVTNIVDCVPEELHVGMGVELTWSLSSGSWIPQFRPAKPEDD